MKKSFVHKRVAAVNQDCIDATRMFIPNGDKARCSRCNQEGQKLYMTRNIYSDYTCKTCFDKEQIGL